MIRCARLYKIYMLAEAFQNGIGRKCSCREFVYSLTSTIPSFDVSCLGHVVNLGNVDVMRQITKTAAVENATAIWEYDPTLDDNRVLGGSLDVIAAIRTLAIKVQYYYVIVSTLPNLPTDSSIRTAY